MLLLLCPLPGARAQEEGASASKGENFSAKPPDQLFASDCTGAGCHKGPQGLAKSMGIGSLAGFLREHYTNSRESAAALAGYLSKLPTGPVPKEREARTPRPARAAPSESRTPAWGEGLGIGASSEPKPAVKPELKPKPEPKEAHTPRHNPARTSRAAARPEEDKETPAARPRHTAEPAETPPKPTASTRSKRGKPPATAAAAASPPPEPASAPAAPPLPKRYDIFD